MRIRLQMMVAVPLFLITALGYAADSSVLPPDATVAGVSQQDYSQRWWQWAASFAHEESPVADRTGALCGSRQSGAVWFLAGTYGTQRAVRTCHVPKGKYLFFPLINYVTFPNGPAEVSCESVTTDSARMTERVALLVLNIDGVRYDGLEQHRLATRNCFDLGALTREKYVIYPAAANGYYVMLKPLPPGRHTLNFGGALPEMLQAVTYTLLVE